MDKKRGTSKEKTGETEEVEKDLAYSVPMKHALKIIIGDTLADKDEIVSCEKYLEEYDKRLEMINTLADKLLKVNQNESKTD